jgi:hypothetical protein
MIRRAAAVILVLIFTPPLLQAQDAVLTVTAPSAEIHKGPSIVTPVIGHAARDTVLPVTRNLGSWVKVDWPAGPDGAGYVHVTMGRLRTLEADASMATMAPRPIPRSVSVPTSTEISEPAPIAPRTGTSAERIALSGPQGVTPISHVFGVGGLVGSTKSFGATARAWRNDHFGIQLRLTRDHIRSDSAAGGVTSMQFEPGVVYSPFDHVSDYVWIRPYLGSGVTFSHQTLKSSAPAGIEPRSDNAAGFHIFGGTELTFASVTRFGLSADLGYRRLPALFPGFETDRLSMSIAGHWYIK